MDIIYHAHCLDGSLSASLIFLYKHFHANKLTKHSDSKFWETIIDHMSTKPMLSINDKIDLCSLQKPDSHITGELDFESLSTLPTRCSLPGEVRLYGLDVSDYDYHFKHLTHTNNSENHERDLLIVADASPKFEYLAALSKAYKLVLIIDHHQTFAKRFKDFEATDFKNVKIVFSNTVSAAALVYVVLADIFGSAFHFFSLPKATDLTQKVRFVSINDTTVSEDQEVVTFKEAAKLLGLHEIAAPAFPQSFKFFAYSVPTLQQMGKGLLVKKNAFIQKSLTTFSQYKVIKKKSNGDAVTFVCYGKLVKPGFRHLSEIGNKLAQRSYYDNGVGLSVIIKKCDSSGFYVSLRATELDDFDCEDLAASFGGGGHKRAAGFMVNEAIFKERIILVQTMHS